MNLSAANAVGHRLPPKIVVLPACGIHSLSKNVWCHDVPAIGRHEGVVVFPPFRRTLGGEMCQYAKLTRGTHMA